MRFLGSIVLGATLLWGGYWFAGYTAAKHVAEIGQQELQRAGWTVEHAGLRVLGFPNRFDLTWTEPQLATPDGAFGWRAPFVQLFALSYKPNHLILVWPHDQHIDTPAGTLRLGTADMRASTVLQPGTDLRLERATLIAAAPKLVSDWQGLSIGATELRLASEADASGTTQHLGLNLTGLAPDSRLMALFDPALAVPAVIEEIRIDALAELSRPIDRHALSGPPPSVNALDLTEARLSWGSVRIRASGRLEPDEAGYATGDIAVTVDDWRKALAVAQALGMIAPEVLPTWENAFAMLSAQSEDPDTVALPLSFGGGMVRFGLLPLGPAPRLR
ncbi:MAG: DUF2125 domain-containing protein [Paracoccaceae bacterium]